MVHIDELEEKRKMRANRNHDLYKGFFLEVSQKIRTRDSLGHRNLIHRIPTIVIGFPLYDINHAIQYVLYKLQKRGFFVYPWTDNYLYVDWSFIKGTTTKKIEQRYKLEKVSLEELDEKIRQI